jgi:hypothetical protein
MRQEQTSPEINKNKALVTFAIVAGVIVMIVAMLGLIGAFTQKKTGVIKKVEAPVYNPVKEAEPEVFYDDGNQQFLNMQANAVNASCPMMIDQITRLDNAIALPNNEFQYNYTLLNTYLASTDINYMQNTMHRTILNGIKTNPALAEFRNRGTTISYSYNDAEGVFMFKMSFTSADYAQ